MKKVLILSLVTVLAVTILVSCGKKTSESGGETVTQTENQTTVPTARKSLDELCEKVEHIRLTLTDGEEIELEIYPDLAPETVKQFKKLCKNGFYEGTVFHRVIKGFMIQGGGYDNEYNLKKCRDTIKGEFTENGFRNDLSHKRGVISMARTGEPDSATSQFFIVHEDSEYLDGKYAAFGRVTSGMEVVDKIASSPLMNNPPAGMQNVTQEQFVIASADILD